MNSGEIEQIEANIPYYQIFTLKNNQTYVSGEKLIKKLEGNKLLKIQNASKILKLLEKDLIIASARYKDSSVFLASNNGNGLYEISLYNDDVSIFTSSSSPLNIKDTRINNLFIDRRSRLFIICDQTISIYDKVNKKIDHYSLKDPISGADLDIIMDVCESNAHYYFAVYGKGIVQTDKSLKITKIISEGQGLSTRVFTRFIASGIL